MLYVKRMWSKLKTCCTHFYYFSSVSLCAPVDSSSTVFYCSVTINHSNHVTLPHAHMQRQTHAPTDVIYLVSYCVMLIGISFCNGGEYIGTPWPLSPLFSQRPIITIWLPFIHLCLFVRVATWVSGPVCVCVCVCVCACVCSRTFQWVGGLLGEPPRWRGCRCSCVRLIVLTSM